jgi:hypothetical protein
MTLRTLATTIDWGDFERRDEMTSGFRRVLADTNHQLGIESVGRENIVPYLTTLTLVGGLLALWAQICAI